VSGWMGFMTFIRYDSGCQFPCNWSRFWRVSRFKHTDKFCGR